MNKIAFLFDRESSRSNYLLNILKDEFEVICVHSYEEIMNLFESSYDSLSALVIDHPSNKDYIEKVFEYVKTRNNYMFSLPVTILTQKDIVEEDDIYLCSVAVGLIVEGDSKRTVLSRIKNTIKFSNSASFDDFSQMLERLPSLIYLKDINGRYAFSSQHWHHLRTPGKSIRGLTDYDIRKSKENARIATESDKKVVNSGQGTRYVIKEDDDEGIDYLQIIKEPLKNKDGKVTGIIAIINNVTDEELLRQELRHKSITDQLTGLYNRVYFEELVKQYEDNMIIPFTVISADCDGLKRINDRFGHSAGDKYICFAKDAIQESLPKDSYIFRMGGDEFVALLPGVNGYTASKLVKAIISNSKKYRTKNFVLKLSVGSHTINKSGLSIESALVLSDKAMYNMKNKSQSKRK